MLDYFTQFFEANLVIIYFVYPLIFFLMGFAILLKNRLYSRFYLARSIHFLALFGIIHGIADWGIFFIPIQSAYLSERAIYYLESIQIVVNALSFFFLFYFGVHLLFHRGKYRKAILSIPIFLFSLWFSLFIFLGPILVNEGNQEWWFAISDIWARYLMAFPGGAIACYALFIQRKQFVELGVPKMIKTLTGASVSIGLYALSGGLIVQYAPMMPTILFNSEIFFTTIGFPIEIFRGLSGALMAFFIIKILKVFDIEYQNFIYQAEKTKALTDERNRIARDLHDGMIQSIYATGLQLEGIRHILTSNRPHQIEAAPDKIKAVTKKLNDIIKEIRGYIKELKVPIDKETKLGDEIERLFKELNIKDHLNVEFSYQNSGKEPALSKTVQIYYILKEALSNVIKHANASSVSIRVEGDNQLLTIKISDDGIGFNKDELNGKQDNFFMQGLRNMSFRAKSIDGTLKLDSILDSGTHLILEVYNGGANDE